MPGEWEQETENWLRWAPPVTDLGHWVEDTDPPTFAVRSPYFESRRVEDTAERDGQRVTFRGWTYTLEDYALVPR